MILSNGNPAVTVDAFDRGLHYGDGLFETIAVVEGLPLLWDRHMNRLLEGCERLGIGSVDPQVLWEESARAIGESPRAVLKILITRGPGGRGYRAPQSAVPTRLIFSQPWPHYSHDYQRTGVSVRLCQTPLGRNPRLSGMKHLNRLEQVLARREWEDEYQEGLMCDGLGYLIEGTMSNIFLVHDGTLETPDVGECGISGVMRAQVLATAERLGISARVAPISTERARDADALFLTNSLIGIWPVREWDGRIFAPNAVVESLFEQLQRDQACVSFF